MPPRRPKKVSSQGSPPSGGGPSFLAVARVRRPFGVRGELLLEVLTEFPRRLLQAEQLFLGDEHSPCAVESIRFHGQDLLLRLKDVAVRDAADKLRGVLLSVRTDDQPALPEGVYYHHQIEGLCVETEEGEKLGTVREILVTGANDVYIVHSGKKEILLPAIPQVIRAVKLEEGKMIVRLMDGLIDGNAG